jgi:DNA (cytosine-5)-methyltransferase 1
MPANNMAAQKGITAIDLFCGAGGLTKGLENSGISVSIGVDIDPACSYPFEANNSAEFILKSVDEISGPELDSKWGSGIKLLAGCAPCQPFSTYRFGTDTKKDDKWRLLYEFSRLIKESKPELITMENVPNLVRHEVFLDFVNNLKSQGYFVSYSVVKCIEYGMPQSRKRLVLLASKFGEIELMSPTHGPGSKKPYVTVKDTVGKLPTLNAGEINSKDKLHQAAELTPINLKRIKASKPGGTWRDWPRNLIAECHKKDSGKSFPGVYARMEWDKPAPTMTTQLYGYGNGRFGHPVQDRAISLREGAMFQSFPKGYKFVKPGEKVIRSEVGRLIGNAVPPKLGEVIGKSLLQHVNKYNG